MSNNIPEPDITPENLASDPHYMSDHDLLVEIVQTLREARVLVEQLGNNPMLAAMGKGRQ